MSVQQLSVNELMLKFQQTVPITLLDVRQPYEFQLAHIDGSRLIPLQQLAHRVSELDPELPTVVICHHGVRSQLAAEFLDNQGFRQVFNVQGGIDAWSLECDSSILRY